MIENLNSIVGQRLSEVFMSEKQETTANRLNVEQGTVSKWKTGRQIPNPETLVMIADMYDVSLDWILGLSDVKERNSLSSDRISYAQVISVLDRLFNLANIEVLNFHEVAKDKNISLGYISENEESLKNDTDYIKINDRVLSYLLRRRKVIYDFDDSMAQDWVDRIIDIFKNQVTLDYRGDAEKIINTKPLSTFKEGDWGGLVEEINNMSDSQMKEYLRSKTDEKDGKKNGR